MRPSPLARPGQYPKCVSRNLSPWCSLPVSEIAQLNAPLKRRIRYLRGDYLNSESLRATERAWDSLEPSRK